MPTENKVTSHVANTKDIHSLKYIAIPKELWSEYLNYQYFRFYIRQIVALSTTLLFFILFSGLVYFYKPDIFLNDLYGRLFLVTVFLFLASYFYIKKKNSEILDILVCILCLCASTQWAIILNGTYETFETYQLTIAGAPLAILSAYITSRYRYAVITCFACLGTIIFMMLQSTHKSISYILIDILYIIIPIITFSLFICWDTLQRSRSNFLKQYRFTKEKNSLAEYNQDLIQQVYTDGLTQIGNKRLFEMEAQTIFTDAKELEIYKIAVLLIDIDFFKNYNDNYGHLEGDVCLKEISATLKTITDLYSANVYRFGGEEFVVSQKFNNKYEVINLARSLIASVTDLAITHEYRADKKNYLTISIGGCVIDEDDFESLHEMLDIADQKLYQAKDEGKETFVI